MLRTLDVIIGLVFVFSILSVVCSAVAEGIESILGRRAANLESGLRRLLTAGGANLVDAFYRHPLIQALYDGDEKGRPSYIPSRTFALAFVDVLAGSDPAKKDGVTLLDRLPENPLGNTVRTLAQSAGGGLEHTLKAVEGWFDDAMDRVGSLYKRGTHWILLVLGLCVAAALNADAVNIASMLATDPALRQSVVEAALKQRANAPASLAPTEQQKGGTGNAESSRGATGAADLQVRTASGEVTGGGTPAAPAQPEPAPSLESARAAATAGIEQLQALSLPIGWSGATMVRDPRGIPETTAGWLTKILGVLVTGFAVSLGAPFWFDVLNKVARLRAATKPEQTDEAK